jgi:predicted RNA-binding protein with TRAM domain
LIKFNQKERRRNKENRFRSSSASVSSPIKVGEEYDVNIEGMSRRGDSGVTRIGGIVVFVNDTRPGESVRIRIMTVGERHATGKVLNQSARRGDATLNITQIKTEFNLGKLARTPIGKEIFDKFASSFRETRDLTQAFDSLFNCARENGSFEDLQNAIIKDILVVLKPFFESLIVKPEKKLKPRSSRFSKRIT